MKKYRRISRIIEHWTLSNAEQILDQVRRAQIQLVQVGNFGADFYSLAEAAPESYPASWTGMPLRGIRANLERAAAIIPQIQEAGAAVVGQFSTMMIFGNEEEKLGVFNETWSHMWTDDLLGAPPCEDVEDLLQRNSDGSPRW